MTLNKAWKKVLIITIVGVSALICIAIDEISKESE